MAARLEATGLVRVVHRWFDQVAQQAADGVRDSDLTDEEQADRADGDLRAIDSAAIFWALWPESPSAGCSLELGYALGIKGLHTVVSGPRVRDCIFAALADCRSLYDDAAFDAVIALARPKALPCLAAGMERP